MTISQALEEIAPNVESDALSDSSFHSHLAKFSQIEWVTTAKQAAWGAFKELPTPTRTNEKWRFTESSHLSIEGCVLRDSVEPQTKADLIGRSVTLENEAASLIIADNHTIAEKPLANHEGIIFCTLEEAFQKHSELLEKHFATNPTQLGSDKYQALHNAYAENGTFLYLPKGTELNQPLVVHHYIAGSSSAIFPKTIIIAEESTKAELIEFYGSANTTDSGLCIASCTFFAGDNANVSRTVVQNFNEHTTAFQLDTTTLHRDTETHTTNVNLGARFARFENQVNINGANANAQLRSLTVGHSDQVFDQRTFQHHNAPHAVSDLLYKNALLDKTKTIFSGMIFVEENAQQTDAYQTNRNLLLSPDADANSLPGLEIKANDVKCSHGATSGKLDTSDLFYMLSRGITPRMAKQLLILGFFQEVLDNVKSEALQGILLDLIEKKFNN